MTWTVIAGLGVVCLVLWIRVGELNRQIDDLRRELMNLGRAVVEGRSPAARAPAEAAPEPARQPQPAVLERALAPTPVARLAPVALAREPAPEPLAEPREPGPTAAQARERAVEWMSEKGLAWLGGAALALGGLMLVAYAASHGFFTPALRIASGAVLGVGLIGFGEVLRRRAGFDRSGLVSALTTGAGAAALYAATWAAYALYHFIGLAPAAMLMSCVSLGLLALAFLHGEALGVLAIAAAFAVPWVTGGPWRAAPLDAFLDLMLATGLATLPLRRWRWVAAASLALAGVSICERLFVADIPGGAVMVVEATALCIAAVILARRAGVEPLWEAPPATALVPAVLIGAAMAALGLTARGAPEDFPWLVAASASVMVGAAVAVRLRIAIPMLMGAPAAMAVLLPLVLLGSHASALADGWTWGLLAALAVSGGVLGAVEGLSLAAIICAGAAALGLTMATPLFAKGYPDVVWALDLALAAATAAVLTLLARRTRDVGESLVIAAFVGAAAEMTALSLNQGLDARAGPIAYSALALALAALARRPGWRGFAEASVTAGLAGLVALLLPPIASGAFLGELGWPMIAGIGLAATAAQAGAWRTMPIAAERGWAREAVSTLAVMTGLAACFLVLARLGVADRHSGPGLSETAQASFRTVLVLAAAVGVGGRPSTSLIGRWRGPALLAIGAAHGLWFEASFAHPWWGYGAPVEGPPLADMLAVGLLAPAALLAVGAHRLRAAHPRLLEGSAGAAVLFLAVWAVSEVRRLFHGPDLNAGAFTCAEAGAYAVALLALWMALHLGLKRALNGAEAARRLVQGIEAAGWGVAALSLLTFGYLASPWWGPVEGPFTWPALLLAMFALGCAGVAAIARMADADRPLLARFATLACGLQLFSLITLIIRFGFHGQAMRAPLAEAGVETWTYSAVWAGFGLAAFVLGRGGRGVVRRLGLGILLFTTAKVFLFDMSQLEGVVRAASFLALGAVLIAGALLASPRPAKPPKG